MKRTLRLSEETIEVLRNKTQEMKIEMTEEGTTEKISKDTIKL